MVLDSATVCLVLEAVNTCSWMAVIGGEITPHGLSHTARRKVFGCKISHTFKDLVKSGQQHLKIDFSLDVFIFMHHYLLLFRI